MQALKVHSNALIQNVVWVDVEGVSIRYFEDEAVGLQKYNHQIRKILPNA